MIESCLEALVRLGILNVSLTGENKLLRDRLKTSHDRLKRLQALKARLIGRAGVLAAESERLQDIKLSLQQVLDLQARGILPNSAEGCNE